MGRDEMTKQDGGDGGTQRVYEIDARTNQVIRIHPVRS